MAQEVEDTLRFIQGSKGVVGALIINSEGIPIKTNFENTESVQYSALTQILAEKGRAIVKELDPTNELTILRIRTKKYEIMVAPDKDYMLVTIQKSTT